MANKLILVPEDMYRALLVQKKTTNSINDTHRSNPLDDGKINLEFTRKKMRRALTSKGGDITAKNINYNQELRRYLRQRKEIVERPLKVREENGAKMMFKPSVSEKTAPQTVIVGDDGELDESFIQNPSTTKASTSMPSKEDNATSRWEDFKITPRATRSTFNINKKTTKMSDEERRSILLGYLYNNAEKLGITKKKGVRRTLHGSPMKTANFDRIVDRILNPGPGSFSPPGTSQLRNRLIKDEAFKKLSKELGLFGSGVGGEQKGKGLGILSSFKPTKWCEIGLRGYEIGKKKAERIMKKQHSNRR